MSLGLVILVGFVLGYELVLAAAMMAHERASGRRAQAERSRPEPPGSFLRATGGILASDRQRDEAAEAIGAALAEGRLGADEAIMRIERALRVRHCAQLQDLVADLPVGRHGEGPPGGDRGARDPVHAARASAAVVDGIVHPPAEGGRT